MTVVLQRHGLSGSQNRCSVHTHSTRHGSSMIFRILVASLLFLTVPPLLAETHIWRNADGTKSIEAGFVKRDSGSVTVLRKDRREVTIPFENLHREDREWLDARHPLPAVEPPPVARHVFDTLEFGNSRAQVTEKLKASPLVEMSLPETMLARTGLNGVFHTQRKVGGLESSLYFDWSDDGGLKDVTLRTATITGDEIEARLRPCWMAYIEILTSQHGPPVQANDKLGIASIQDQSMSATHLWKLEHGGSVMLGAAREGDGYQIAVRFTTEDVQPVIIPAPAPPAPAGASSMP